jgi:hypothetical protein
MTALLIRILLFLVVIVPLLIVSKSQGQPDARSALRAAGAAVLPYVFGFSAVALVMLLLELVFIGF